jgi:predicted nucleic acid-binding protein
LRRHVTEPDAADLLRWVADSATVVVDPGADAPVHSRDPDDDYLIAVASAHQAALVSGDKHLLALAGKLPVFSPRGFLDLLGPALTRG